MKTHMLSLAGLLVICLSTMGRGDERQPSVGQLVDAHRKARDRVVAADVRMDVVLHSRTNPERTIKSEWRWSIQKDKDLERIRMREIGSTLPGNTNNYCLFAQDSFLDRTNVSQLITVEREPRDGFQRKSQSVKADVRPRSRDLRGVGAAPRVFLLPCFQGEDHEPYRTLEELVAEASMAEVRGKVQLDGAEVWHLHVVYQADRAVEKEAFRYDIFLDPAVSYQVRKSVASHKCPKADRQLEQVTTVKRFQAYKDGILLPAETEYCEVEDGKPGALLRIQIRDAVLNATLPADALDFKCPKPQAAARDHASFFLSLLPWLLLVAF